VAFTLPPKWYLETTEKLVGKLEPELGKLSAETAWRYMYALVGWFRPVAGKEFFHLNDRLSKKGGQEEAVRGEHYLNSHLAPGSTQALKDLVDQLGKAYDSEWVAQGNKSGTWQRTNVTGTSMEVAIQVLIQRINGVWASRAPKLNTLRGFELAPSGYHSRPDLALFSPVDFRLIVSTKWTMRKDRLGTFLHEAYFYKQRRPDLQIAFVVSEFSLNILEHLVGDPLVERVYHLCLPMLLYVHEPFAKYNPSGNVPLELLLHRNKERRDYARWLRLSDRLFDLPQLFADIDGLKAAAAPVVIPDEPSDEEKENAAEEDDSGA
jgi:hypothetical protein